MSTAQKTMLPFLKRKLHQSQIYLGLVILISVLTGYANDLEMVITGKGNLLIQADCYQFAQNDQNTRLEIAYEFALNQFDKERIQSDSLELTIALRVSDSENNLLINSHEKKVLSLKEIPPDSRDAFVDLKKCVVRAGKVNFSLIIKDSGNHYQGKIVQDITVKDFSTGLSFSDPFFISILGKARGDEVFDRQNIFAVPSPARRVTVNNNQKEFFVFLEVNNLHFNPENSDFYSLNGRIEDLSGKSLTVINHEAIKKIAENTSRLEKFNVSEIPSGIYKLIFNLSDAGSTSAYTITRYFQIENQLIGNSTVLPMTENDIKKYYDQIKYIATDQELDIFNKLDNAGKERFLLQFWKLKDDHPDTPENEFMKEHFRRIAYCENAFRGGINSDRARIYIKYGPPVNIERSTSTLGYSKPVEIWTYAFDGTIEFVFVDRTNDGNYVLVHSTHPEEFSNPDWEKNFTE
jgi:GWxTD domain-containing protein